MLTITRPPPALRIARNLVTVTCPQVTVTCADQRVRGADGRQQKAGAAA